VRIGLSFGRSSVAVSNAARVLTSNTRPGLRVDASTRRRGVALSEFVSSCNDLRKYFENARSLRSSKSHVCNAGLTYIGFAHNYKER
jgi:hypothetical protein